MPKIIWFQFPNIKLTYDGPEPKSHGCFRIYEKQVDAFKNEYWVQTLCIQPKDDAVHRLFMAHAEDQKPQTDPNSDEVPF